VAGDSSEAHDTETAIVSVETREDWLTRLLRPSWWLAVAAVASVLLMLWGIKSTAWRHEQLDLRVYLLGAKHLFDGSIYFVRIPLRPYLPFTYTPFAGLAFWPLTLFSFSTAQIIWLVISVVAFLLVIALSLWCVRPDLDRARLWTATAVLCGPLFYLEPIKANFHFGQVNIVLVLMVFADLTVTLRVAGRTLPRGILLGVAAAVKLIPLIFVAYLFVTRQFRAALVATASFLTCFVVAALCNPHATWLYMTKYALDAKRIGSVFYLSNQSLRGSLDRMVHVELSTIPVTVAAVVVLVAGLALAWWAYRRSSALLGVLVTATTGLLVSPITWTHHVVWAIPVIAWLALAADRPAGGKWWALGGAAVIWTAPMWLVSSANADELNENVLESIVANSYFFVMSGFLIGICVMLARRERRGVLARATATP